MHPNGTAAVAWHQAGPVSPVITREADATLTLSPPNAPQWRPSWPG